MIPGNDDAMRAITFYCDLAQAAVLDGLQTELIKSGGDIGATVEAPVEAAILEPSDEVAIPAEVLAEEASAVDEAPALAGATGEAEAAVTAEKIV
jgi:small subunit ribosomal protein S2